MGMGQLPSTAKENKTINLEGAAGAFIAISS